MIAAYLAKRNARGSSNVNLENNSGGGSYGEANNEGNSSLIPGAVSYTRPRSSLSCGSNGKKSDGSCGENTSLLDTPVHSMVPTLSPTHSSPHAGSLSPGAAGGQGSSSPPSSLPPELPPRSVSSSFEGSAQRSAGHTSASWHSSAPTPQGFSLNHRSVSGISNAVSPPPNVALGESSCVAMGSSSSSKSDKRSTKERCGGGGGGMSLMRKFAGSSKKKSKSPPPSYSMDNPVFEDSTVSTSVQLFHTSPHKRRLSRYTLNLYSRFLPRDSEVLLPTNTTANFNIYSI
ncbi:uncharacterized protein LOC121863965 isoform X2 [Homarus americanus]|uniref:uncharacterized protein LOC121863965 isoform X2 n=1 Tax=Homarus americanus TaxID=6706 RepID=UPI001C43879B|nr:uncharacterized protein LOC121863965 isoform X2 [Homarus americanus]